MAYYEHEEWSVSPIMALRAKGHTPEITSINTCWKVPLKIRWTIPVKFHWTSDNPLENTTGKLRFVGKCRWQSIGKCHRKSTMISEVSISGVRSFAPAPGVAQDRLAADTLKWLNWLNLKPVGLIVFDLDVPRRESTLRRCARSWRWSASSWSPATVQSLYWNLAIISPTIISERKPWIVNNKSCWRNDVQVLYWTSRVALKS